MSNAPESRTPQPAPKKSKKWLVIAVSLVAAAAVVVGVVIAINLGGSTDATPGQSPSAEPTSSAAPVERVAVPDVVGLSVADAQTALEEAGLEGEPLLSSTPDATVVTGQSVTAGLEVKAGQNIILTTD